MKTKTAAGNYLIQGGSPNLKTNQHDLWLSHSDGYGNFESFENASTETLFATKWQLKSGEIFYYLNTTPGINDDAYNFALNVAANESVGYPLGDTGEVYNRVVRPVVIEKWTEAQFNTWLAS